MAPARTVKKLLILGILMLLLLAGGGGAAWWFLLREPPEEDAVAEAVESLPELVFVDFDPMVISVLRGDQATDHLTFMIILQVEDAERRGIVFRQTPRLRDAFRSEIHAVLSRRIMQDRPDTMPILSKRLRDLTNGMLGDNVVKRVLINIMTKRDLEPA